MKLKIPARPLSVNGKFVLRFQNKNVVFKFIQRSVDEA